MKNLVVYLYVTSCGGIRSALTHLYCVIGKDMYQEFKKGISQFMPLMNRVIAYTKRQYGISLEEEKKAMSFNVYKKLCDIIHQGEGEDFIFAHLFLTMEWNLVAISDNSVNMHITYIQWRSDCLIFYFGTPKRNQNGEISSDPWHVYSNPKNPTICPILSLAKYILFNPDIMTTNSPLFPGNCQYDRFLKNSTNSSRNFLIVFRHSELKKEFLEPNLPEKELCHCCYWLYCLSTHGFNLFEG